MNFENYCQQEVIKFMKGLIQFYSKMEDKPRYKEVYIDFIELILIAFRDVKLRTMYLKPKDKCNYQSEFEIVLEVIQFYLNQIAPIEDLIKSEYSKIYCPSKTYDEWLEYHIKSEKLQLIDNPQNTSEDGLMEKPKKVQKSPFRHIIKMCKSIVNLLQKKKEYYDKDALDVSKLSEQQKLDIIEMECQIVETFANGRHHHAALRYFLTMDHLLMSDWNLLDHLIRNNKNMRLQTETIHKISLSLMICKHWFEAILIYQLVNLNDESIKETIFKIIDYVRVSLGPSKLQVKFKKEVGLIWSIDLLSILVINLNKESKYLNLQRSVIDKIKKKKIKDQQQQNTLETTTLPLLKQSNCFLNFFIISDLSFSTSDNNFRKPERPWF